MAQCPSPNTIRVKIYLSVYKHVWGLIREGKQFIWKVHTQPGYAIFKLQEYYSLKVSFAYNAVQIFLFFFIYEFWNLASPFWKERLLIFHWLTHLCLVYNNRSPSNALRIYPGTPDISQSIDRHITDFSIIFSKLV